MHGDWPWALLLLLISPAVGSFLAVLVDRLPIGGSVLTASRCNGCGVRLRWRDMVPVLSALTLGGRCRNCGAAIPGHLMRIEIAALLAALLVVALVPGVGMMWLHAALLWVLIALFYADLLHFRLPDLLNAALLGLGMLLALAEPQRGFLDAAISAMAGAGAFWLIRWGYFQWRGREGLGLGDVKLMAGIGAALGWQIIPMVTLLAAALALVVALIGSLRSKTAPKADTRLPFGSYLTAAAAIFLLI